VKHFLTRLTTLCLSIAWLALTVDIAQAQVTSLPSPTCGKPVFSVPTGSSITLKWNAPTTENKGVTPIPAGTAISYNLYSVGGPNPVVVVGAQQLATTSIVRSNLSAGTPCYAVTAVINGVESALSNTAAVEIIDTPDPPITLTCTITLPSTGGPASGTCVTSP
jgi:hypothetical protein